MKSPSVATWATLDHETDGQVTMRDFSAGHISNEGSHRLIADLEAECGSEQFHFKPGVGYRHLVIYKGDHPGFETVPPHDFIEQDITVHFKKYFEQAHGKTLFEKAQNLLVDHRVKKSRLQQGKNPAILFWLWGEGKMPVVPPLTEKFNITGSMISAVDLFRGLGVLGGLTPINTRCHRFYRHQL